MNGEDVKRHHLFDSSHFIPAINHVYFGNSGAMTGERFFREKKSSDSWKSIFERKRKRFKNLPKSKKVPFGDVWKSVSFKLGTCWSRRVPPLGKMQTEWWVWGSSRISVTNANSPWGISISSQVTRIGDPVRRMAHVIFAGLCVCPSCNLRCGEGLAAGGGWGARLQKLSFMATWLWISSMLWGRGAANIRK